MLNNSPNEKKNDDYGKTPLRDGEEFEGRGYERNYEKIHQKIREGNNQMTPASVRNLASANREAREKAKKEFGMRKQAMGSARKRGDPKNPNICKK